MEKDTFNIEIQEVENMHQDKVKILTNPCNVKHLRMMLHIIDCELKKFEEDNNV